MKGKPDPMRLLQWALLAGAVVAFVLGCPEAGWITGR
jgi:hypothetical protein